MPRALFISDLHLSRERPASSRRFFRFLSDEAAHAASLYVLGDLFDYWIGDDELDAADAELGREVCAGLDALARGGVAVHIMHGNRDFLLDGRFFAAAGARALPDPSVVGVDGVPTLLTHGDTLCGMDTEYLRFRAQVREPSWQREFLAQTLEARRTQALELRAASERGKRAKALDTMDVREAEVVAAFRRHGVARMIHGHTHRPARHDLEIDARRCERWVLPDWTGAAGGYLAADGGALRLVTLAPAT